MQEQSISYQGLSMYSELLRKTLLGLAFSLIASTVVAEKRLYPRANQTQMVVGTEEFEENYSSLAGLEGVHVVTMWVFKSATKHNLTDMKTDLVEQIDKRLNSVGLRMLNHDDVKTTPGQPSLTFFPAYTGTELDFLSVINLGIFSAISDNLARPEQTIQVYYVGNWGQHQRLRKSWHLDLRRSVKSS